ncbi:hypothetical protein E2562_021828 [Oryza meyeriana var. granulata]|uniref:RING-type domain-containing protein n=1 Tax=Oryza meyeriana var. granulata TaxID=110450 RepID=A0A6G1ENB2_9ORYZ|nr:hypothetical protein E2562_021828 [Oryza meyeriana var. granulata]
MDNASELAGSLSAAPEEEVPAVVAVSAVAVPPSALTDFRYHDDIDYDVEDDESGDEDDESMKVRDDDPPVDRDNLPFVHSPFVPKGKFLSPVRFAAVRCTAGYMPVTTVVVEGESQSPDAGDAGGGEKDIMVLYCYTRYSRTWSRRKGVEMSRRAKLNRLRFIISTAADDVASSLPWAGSSLAPLIYPFYFRDELQELWSALVAIAPVNIPPRATRVEVFVDVGILWPFDHTPERIEFMRRELEAKKDEAWPGHHVGVEMNLPEPVLCKRGSGNEEEEEDGASPVKRKRVVDGVAVEDCSICLIELETDLVAWPGCSVAHIFHGECLKMNLEMSDKCPLCRKDMGIKDF